MSLILLVVNQNKLNCPLKYVKEKLGEEFSLFTRTIKILINIKLVNKQPHNKFDLNILIKEK